MSNLKLQYRALISEIRAKNCYDHILSYYAQMNVKKHKLKAFTNLQLKFVEQCNLSNLDRGWF
jgi:hypothetical protein